jgi:hypothetical protein
VAFDEAVENVKHTSRHARKNAMGDRRPMRASTAL